MGLNLSISIRLTRLRHEGTPGILKLLAGILYPENIELLEKEVNLIAQLIHLMCGS